MPESLEIIEDYSLCGETDIYIGKNLRYIETTCFDGANKNITISPENPFYKTLDGTLILSKDGKRLCAVSKNLDTYDIPKCVETISSNSFFSKTNIMKIRLSENIKVLEPYSFKNATNLKRIELSNFIEKIGINAFENCGELREIVIDKAKDSILGAPWGNPFGLRAVKWLR